jgi:hypothetical protein
MVLPASLNDTNEQVLESGGRCRALAYPTRQPFPLKSGLKHQYNQPVTILLVVI